MEKLISNGDWHASRLLEAREGTIDVAGQGIAASHIRLPTFSWTMF